MVPIIFCDDDDKCWYYIGSRVWIVIYDFILVGIYFSILIWSFVKLKIFFGKCYEALFGDWIE